MKFLTQARSLALLLFFFLLLAGSDLSFPGLNHDELFFAGGTLGHWEECCMHRAAGRVPVLLLPYLGALKSWLFEPVNFFFGLNLFSIRIPLLLLHGLSLFLFSRALPLGRASLLALALLAFNPAFVFAARQDIGELSLYFFFLSLTLYCFRKGEARESLALWVALSFALLLGGFHRLNFLWFTLPFLGSVFLLFPPFRIQAMATLAAALALAFAQTRWASLPTGPEIGIPSLEKASLSFSAWNSLLSGKSYWEALYLESIEPGRGWFWLLPLLGLLALFPVMSAMNGRERRWTSLLLLTSLGGFGFYFITERAYRLWHIFPVWVCFVGAFSLLAARAWEGRPGQKAVAGLSLFSLFASYGAWAFAHWQYRNEAPKAFYSEAIYGLQKACREADALCVDVERAVYNQLLVALPEEKRPRMLPHLWKMPPEEFAALARPLLEQNSLFVFWDDAWKLPLNQGNLFLDRVEELGYEAIDAGEVKDPQGRVVYRLRKFRRVRP